MFERRLPSEFEIAIYRSYEKELLTRLELRRLADVDRVARPSVVDELLLRAGNAIIAFGQWMRAWSLAADLAGQAPLILEWPGSRPTRARR